MMCAAAGWLNGLGLLVGRAQRSSGRSPRMYCRVRQWLPSWFVCNVDSQRCCLQQNHHPCC